jgi:GDP-D-mannose 3',5'-epimerase
MIKHHKYHITSYHITSYQIISYHSSCSDVIDIDQDFILADLTSHSVAQQYVRCSRTLYHLADIVAGIGFVFSNQLFVFQQNIMINTNVLQAAVASQTIGNYVYVGTACRYSMV